MTAPSTREAVSALLIALRAPWDTISARTKRSRGAVQHWREGRSRPNPKARRAALSRLGYEI